MTSAIDPSNAFILGPELLEAGNSGVLGSVSFAVKDLFDVRNTKTGAGNPDWLADAKISPTHAPSVARLIDAGATLVGKTITDELAFSLSGTNVHYGTPTNPTDSTLIPGGSSSGSASAVAAGTVQFALGTDTAGSIRVPASYCGIWGFRPSTGRITTDGVVPLAPSFDTVGILANSGNLIDTVFNVLKDSNPPQHGRSIERLVAPLDLFALVDLEVDTCLRSAVRRLAKTLQLSLSWENVIGDDTLALCRNAFRQQQLSEAWQCHGAWITKKHPKFGPGIAARFDAASKALRPSDYEMSQIKYNIFSLLRQVMLPGSLLVLPVTPNSAPAINQPSSEKEKLRQDLFSLNVLAGFLGAPELVIPIQCNSLPIGLGIMGLPGEDEVLTAMASSLSFHNLFDAFTDKTQTVKQAL